MDHLRYSGLPFEEQRAAFLVIVAADPLLAETLARVRQLALPDWLVVSGALYNSVWNHLTGKPPGYGIKDVDLFYFDDADLSYEAEDAVIRRAAQHFESLPLPVEVRNQARVHLWYPQKFGQECPRYANASESVSYFASKTHAVGVRFGRDGALDLVAPFGLDDFFRFASRRTGRWTISGRMRRRGEGLRRIGPRLVWCPGRGLIYPQIAAAF